MIKVANIIRHPRGPRLIAIKPAGEGAWAIDRSWTDEPITAPSYDDAVVGAAYECARADALPDSRNPHRDDILLALSHIQSDSDGGAA